jgi:hypothetical protein
VHHAGNVRITFHFDLLWEFGVNYLDILLFLWTDQRLIVLLIGMIFGGDQWNRTQWNNGKRSVRTMRNWMHRVRPSGFPRPKRGQCGGKMTNWSEDFLDEATCAKVSRAVPTRSDTKEQEVDILDKIDSWCMVYLAIGHGGTNRNKQ